jgi:DNA mismatch repair ATPase MutS
LLSAFGREVVMMRDALRRGVAGVLVLVDEFARTTTPHEGRALLVALARRLRAGGATALLATHLADIARAAGVEHFAVAGLRDPGALPAAAGSLDEALDALAAAMDYHLERVHEAATPKADALALAALLGLDPGLIAEARAVL